MRKGPICRIPLERTERRDDARLPAAWVRTSPAPAALNVSTVHLRRSDLAEPVRVAPGSPVLVMLNASHDPAMDELLAAGSAGARVYVLAPAGWGQECEPRLLACPKILIRRLPEVPAAGVYRTSGARLWMGAAPNREAPWCLLLDAMQAEAFRQVFLRLFWHHTTDEAWTGGTQLAFRPSAERPFDVPELPRSSPIRLLSFEEGLEVDTRDALVHRPDGAPPVGTPRRLWFPPSSSHHRELARLVKEGAEVVWESHTLPELVIGKQHGFALLPGIHGRLRVALNPAQAADARQILESSPSWRFEIDLRLGDHASAGHRLWLDGAPADCPVEPEQGIDLPNVQSEQIRATPETMPISWPAAQPLALTARYRWTALPPQLPAGSEEDPLVGRWRQLDQAWSASICKVRAALESTGDHRSQIGAAFSRLLSSLLGFERAQKQLLDDLTALDPRKPSEAGPAAAPALFQKLTEIEDRARKLQGDQEEAKRKAEEEREREEQQQEWQIRVKKAQHELTERRAELAKSEPQLPDLATELATVEDAMKSSDKKARKDLQARQASITDDINRLKRSINRLQAEVIDLEKRAAETFTFKPAPKPTIRPAQGAARFIPQAIPARTGPNIPDEALPSKGVLRRHRGQRYLVIETWEELTHGEKDAVRLNARLVSSEVA